MCQDLKCLPGPGALLDQDSFFVYAIDLVVAAQRARQELDDNKRQAEMRRNQGQGR